MRVITLSSDAVSTESPACQHVVVLLTGPSEIVLHCTDALHVECAVLLTDNCDEYTHIRSGFAAMIKSRLLPVADSTLNVQSPVCAL